MAGPMTPSPWLDRTSRWARWLPALLAVLGAVLVALSGPPVAFPSGAHAAVSPPAAVIVGRTLPAAGPALSGLYTLSGVLAAYGTPAIPLDNVNVTVAAQGCTWPPSALTCTTLATQPTSNGGAFAFSLSNGSYFVYSANTSRWGGDWDAVTINGAAQTVNLLVYPWVPYGNATLVLPAWNNLSAYAANCNAQTPCMNSTYGSQVPILSWTQDGAFYVNATDELVFYSFVNRSVAAIAPWVPLYQNVMVYDGIEDTEWITADGSWVYTVGCLALCTTNTALTYYGANVTTGRTFEYNFTGVTRQAFLNNAQLDMIGIDGNHSIAALIAANGVVRAYNVWNQTQWTLGTLSFFEANNAYWIPQLNSYVDVQAQGSTLDNLYQYRLTGTGAGGGLQLAYSGTYAKSYKSNGVDGLYLNVTSRDLVVTESSAAGNLTTQVFGWNAAGTITGEVRAYSGLKLGAWPNATARPNPVTSEHRPGLASQTPMLMGYWNSFFNNNSWLYEPNSGTYYETNVTMSAPPSSGTYRQASIPPSAVEGLFFNTTYEILEQSVSCRQVDSYCPIGGTADGAAVGTIWWSWRLGAPEFPFPSTAAIAQPNAPGAVLNLGAHALSNAVRVNWTPPTSGQDPLVNYTVLWSEAGSDTWTSASVPSAEGSFEINGLLPQTTVSYAVLAWNLHWHGPPAFGSITTTPRPQLILNFTAQPSVLDLQMPLSLVTSIPSNVTTPTIRYSGLPAGCTSANISVLLCEPTASGRFTVVVTVTNVLNESDSATTNVTVNPQLSPVIIQSPSDWDVGTPLNLSVSVSGSGTPPYTYAWTFDDGSNATGAAVQHIFRTAGYHVVRALATDHYGETQNGSTLLAVHPALAVQLAAFPQPAAAGAPLNVTANVGVSGSAPYVFRWSAGAPQDASGSTVELVFATPGAYAVSVVVEDGAGAVAAANLSIQVVVAPLSASLLAAHGGIADVGVATTLSLSAQGGTPPYAAAITGLPFSCASADEAHWTCIPNVAGTFTADALIRDAHGLSGAAATALVVHPHPAVGLVADVPGPVHPGDSIGWLIAVTGGTPPYNFSFPQLPPGCESAMALGPNLTCVPPESGTFPVSVRVVDALGAVANATTNLTVVPTPVVRTIWHPTPLSTGPDPITLVGWVMPAAAAAVVAAGMAWMLRPPAAPPPRRTRPPVPPTTGAPPRPAAGTNP